jgi:hypothetical protein
VLVVFRDCSRLPHIHVLAEFVSHFSMDARVLENVRQHIQADNASTKELCFTLFRMIEARADCTGGVVDIYLHASASIIAVAAKDNDATGGIALNFLVIVLGRERPHVLQRQEHPSTSLLLNTDGSNL